MTWTGSDAAIRYLDELDDLLGDFGIDSGEVVVVGSAVLAHRGVRPNGDLDIVLSERAYSDLLDRHGERLTINRHGSVWFNDRCQAVRDRYADIGLSDGDLFSERHVEEVGGRRMLRAEVEFVHKVRRNRKKDVDDLPTFERSALDDETWDWGLVHELLVHPPQQPRVPVPANHWRRRIRRVPRGLLTRPTAHARTVVGLARRAVSRVQRKVTGNAPTPALRLQLVTSMSVGALLDLQRSGDSFLRYDILLRSMAARVLMDGQQEGSPVLDAYTRMQVLRGNRPSVLRLRNLVDSVVDRGLDQRHPIPLSREGRVIDGAHRLGVALAIDADEIRVDIHPSRQRVDFGRRWFEDRGFSAELLAEMDSVKRASFVRHGVYTTLILWPPAGRSGDEIVASLASRFAVVADREAELGEQFDDTVRSIYEIDDIDSWKVEVKLAAMRPYGTTIRLVLLDIDEHRFRRKARTGSYLSAVGAELKAEIRRSYRAQVKGYVHDIICHTGDNHEHNRRAIQILEPHLGGQRWFEA